MISRKGKACEKNLFKNVFIEINIIAENFLFEKYRKNMNVIFQYLNQVGSIGMKFAFKKKDFQPLKINLHLQLFIQIQNKYTYYEQTL